VIVSEAKFIKILVEITDTDLVVLADNAALEDSPKAFNRIGMDMAYSVGHLMIDSFMVDDMLHRGIATIFVSNQLATFKVDIFPYDTA
jgi:hypothetical protein